MYEFVSKRRVHRNRLHAFWRSDGTEIGGTRVKPVAPQNTKMGPTETAVGLARELALRHRQLEQVEKQVV